MAERKQYKIWHDLETGIVHMERIRAVKAKAKAQTRARSRTSKQLVDELASPMNEQGIDGVPYNWRKARKHLPPSKDS